MTFLCRLLIVSLFALFAVRGAAACEHATSAIVAPCAVSVAGEHGGVVGNAGHHSHSGCPGECCVAGCGLHCAAPLVEARFDAHLDGASGPPVFLDSHRAGITHAPPLPPPIV